MKKNILIIIGTILSFAISGCVPAYYNSNVIEKPNQPINQMLIVIERPSFSLSNNDVSLQNALASAALYKYGVDFIATTKKDFVKVMSDNGINSKLIFIPKLYNSNFTLDLLPYGEQKKWQYILLIRHIKGKTICQYSHCEALFKTEAKILDITSSKTIWSANDFGPIYYGYNDWKEGKMYTYLLERLNSDNIIQLENKKPIIKTDQN